MTSRIGELVVDSADPPRLAAFWAEVLGYEVVAQDETGVVIAGSPTAPTVLFARSLDPKPVKNRLHLDLCPTGTDQHSELARLLALGARRSESVVGSGSWVVLEDPEGNEFCLMAKAIPAEPEPFHPDWRALGY